MILRWIKETIDNLVGIDRYMVIRTQPPKYGIIEVSSRVLVKEDLNIKEATEQVWKLNKELNDEI